MLPVIRNIQGKMNSHRPLRVAQAVREVVANAIIFDVHDPRVKNVTILGAEVSPDLRHAKVFFTVTGDEREQKRVMYGLQSARGFLQSKIAARLQTRVTPELRFEFDDSTKRTADLLRLIESTVTPDESNATENDDDSDEPGVDDDSGE
ncbi:MAG: 30S ribosome-binding factor RbfA [Planctomycetota bacterium]